MHNDPTGAPHNWLPEHTTPNGLPCTQREPDVTVHGPAGRVTARCTGCGLTWRSRPAPEEVALGLLRKIAAEEGIGYVALAKTEVSIELMCVPLTEDEYILLLNLGTDIEP